MIQSYPFSHNHGSGKLPQMKGNYYWRDLFFTSMIMEGRVFEGLGLQKNMILLGYKLRSNTYHCVFQKTVASVRGETRRFSASMDRNNRYKCHVLI